MKFFITGSTGFIGRNFLDLLLKSFKGHEVVLLQRNPRYFYNSDVRIISGDLHIIDTYKSELIDSDYVFHIAASADVNSKVDILKNDYKSLKVILSALKGNGNLKRFVFVSTIGAFDREVGNSLNLPISNASKPNPRSLYGSYKLESEALIQKSNIPYTVFRPSWVWGKGMRVTSHLSFFNRLIEKGNIISRIGFPGRASFVHVEDLANGMLKVIKDDEKYLNKSYFVSSETRKINEVLKSLLAESKKKTWLINIDLFRIFKLFHGVLPLPFNFLFFDYLICDKDEFITDFKITSPKLLENNISEVKHRDQYAVVTGANSGIGFEISKILESRYHMVLIDKETGNLDLLNSETVNICVDLSDRDELRRSLSNINLNRQISLLINNAGVGFKENFVDTEMRKDLLTADVNVIAPIILSHHFKNELINTKGTIVNISSSVGHFPLPHMASYSASKSFISFWSQGVEEELRGRVNVVTFSPCGTRTGFQKRAGVKVSSDLMDPSKVAEEILFSILKGKSVFKVLGSKSKVLIIIMTVLPRVIGIKLVAKLFQGNR